MIAAITSPSLGQVLPIDSSHDEGMDTVKVSVLKYDGFGFEPVDAPVEAKSSNYRFTEPLARGYYQLHINHPPIGTLFYSDGIEKLSFKIDSTSTAMQLFYFSDVENQALSKIRFEQDLLFLKLNELNQNFNPSEVDSFYIGRLLERNRLSLEVNRDFNKAIRRISKEFDESQTAKFAANVMLTPVFDEDPIHGQQYDNQQAYLRDHFFDRWELEDPNVMFNPELKIKIETYFNLYCKTEYDFTVQKCEELVGKTSNEEVRKYLATQLIRFFKIVQEQDVVNYITHEILHGDLTGVDQRSLEIHNTNVIGSIISPLVLSNDLGVQTDLRSVYKESPFTLVYFWMPDCGQCESLHPLVMDAVTKFDGLSVFDVAVVDDIELWKSTLEQYDLPFVNVIASNAQREQIVLDFRFTSTPYLLLLDQTGRIIERGIEQDQLVQTLSRHL